MHEGKTWTTYLELVPSPMRLLSATGACNNNPIASILPLFGRQKARRRDGVGEEIPNGKGPQEGQDAEDDVHPVPRANAVVDVADPKGQQTRDHAADGVPSEPDAGPRGNLVARVPRRREEHEGGRDGGLADAQEEAHRQETAVVGAGRCDGDNGAPEERVGRHVPGHREAGDEKRGWVRPGEVAEVEDTGYPAVLLANEVLWLVSRRVL